MKRVRDPAALAKLLASKGYDVTLRSSEGGGGGASCLRNLRHEFILCGSDQDVQIYVDINFQEQFMVAQPSEHYHALLESVPASFVGTRQQLLTLVKVISAELQFSFERSGMAVPPWRQVAAQMTKWLPARYTDTVFRIQRGMVRTRSHSKTNLHALALKSPARGSGLQPQRSIGLSVGSWQGQPTALPPPMREGAEALEAGAAPAMGIGSLDALALESSGGLLHVNRASDGTTNFLMSSFNGMPEVYRAAAAARTSGELARPGMPLAPSFAFVRGPRESAGVDVDAHAGRTLRTAGTDSNGTSLDLEESALNSPAPGALAALPPFILRRVSQRPLPELHLTLDSPQGTPDGHQPLALLTPIMPARVAPGPNLLGRFSPPPPNAASMSATAFHGLSALPVPVPDWLTTGAVAPAPSGPEFIPIPLAGQGTAYISVSMKHTPLRPESPLPDSSAPPPRMFWPAAATEAENLTAAGSEVAGVLLARQPPERKRSVSTAAGQLSRTLKSPGLSQEASGLLLGTSTSPQSYVFGGMAAARAVDVSPRLAAQLPPSIPDAGAFYIPTPPFDPHARSSSTTNSGNPSVRVTPVGSPYGRIITVRPAAAAAAATSQRLISPVSPIAVAQDEAVPAPSLAAPPSVTTARASTAEGGPRPPAAGISLEAILNGTAALSPPPPLRGALGNLSAPVSPRPAPPALALVDLLHIEAPAAPPPPRIVAVKPFPAGFSTGPSLRLDGVETNPQGKPLKRAASPPQGRGGTSASVALPGGAAAFKADASSFFFAARSPIGSPRAVASPISPRGSTPSARRLLGRSQGGSSTHLANLCIP